MPKIYLDMDGVLCNWTDAVFERLGLGRAKDFLYKHWPSDKYNLQEAFGIDQSEIDSIVSSTDFWADLKKFSWTDELMELVRSYTNDDDIFICSSPGTWTYAYSGKVMWIKENYPFLKNNIILTRHKNLIRAPGVLIDDKGKTINRLVEDKRNGYRPLNGILFPQPWNALRELNTHEQKMEYVSSALEFHFKE